MEAILLAFSFSVAAGVLVGISPGFKTARLHPIQA